MKPAVLVVVALSVFAGCSFSAVSPSSAALNLRDGAVDIPLDQSLVFTFSGPVNQDAVQNAFLVFPAIDGAFDTSADGRTFTWRPAKAWSELTVYDVIVASLHDHQGRLVPGRHWSFLTTVTPRITTAFDAAGAVFEQGEAVKLDFNVPMDETATTFAINGAAATPTWSEDARSAQLPTDKLPVGDATVALTAGRDQLGHTVAAWSLKVQIEWSIHIQTTHLAYPALVQVPNDGYGARPQVGLQAASLVFEYLTEGDITRLTAVFTDVPATVGPVRSARRISPRLTHHYQGVLFYSGVSNAMDHFLAANPIPAVPDIGAPYYRDYSRPLGAPNNLMLPGDGIASLTSSKGLAASTVAKGHPALSGGDAATSFGVTEQHTSYDYDAATGTYLKTEDGQQMVDASLNSQPLQLFMVVVVHTKEFLVPDIESGCCTHGRDFDLDSGGAADFYYRGAHYAGNWSAADANSPLQFKLADGTPLTLPVGLVWVDVIGS